MVGESRATWFSRIWSWNPNASWDMVKEKVESGNGGVAGTSTSTTVDFEENTKTFSMIDGDTRGLAESFKRRNAVRTRTKQGRIVRPNAEDDKNIMKSSPTTIFDHYHPWKVEPIEKALALLPPNYQPIFKDAMDGRSLHLGQYLASLESTENIRSAVNYVDEQGRSPIHFAAAFGHPEVIKLLLAYGANPNCLAKDIITPLVCAVVAGKEKVMDLLIAEGADINHGLEKPTRGKAVHNATDAETESHTALSWAVRSGNVSSVKYLLKKGALLAGTTINFETPLHEVAYLGNLAILKLLVQEERNLQSLELRGGEDKNTALHIAVEQGHLDCMELLLSVGASANKFNIHGRTPLQIAAMTKDFPAIQLLLKYGADVNTRDTSNRTPLHYCVHLASSSNYLEAIECIELLLRHGADINFQDVNGFAPFHSAVETSASPIVATLLKQGADLTLTNNAGQSGVDILVKKMPHAIRYIRESLDFAIYVESSDIGDPDCTISLDFRPIVVTNIGDKETMKLRNETDVLLSFCAFGHKDILSHPLIEAFLILKWQRVMKYFWVSFIANLLMIITYSYFVFHLYATKCPLISQNSTREIMLEQDRPKIQKMSPYLEMVWFTLFTMLFVFMTKELLQLISSPKSYFKIVENYVQLVFIILALMTILPDPLGPIIRGEDICSCLHRWNYIHYSTASVSLVVAWFLILLRVGKLPKLGLYVQMLFKVVGNFGIIIITYSSIVIAFTLAFGILFDESTDIDSPQFNNIFHSFLTTMVMLTGELELIAIIKQTDPRINPLFVTTYIIFIAFLLLVTIVLMNLLVGLAVSDIQGLKAGAKVARLSRLVVAISQLESMLFSRHFTLLPKKLVSHLRRNALLSYNDKICSFQFRPHDPRDITLPQCLQLEALQILEKRENDRIRSMKIANQETDTKLELLERMERIETLIQQMATKSIHYAQSQGNE